MVVRIFVGIPFLVSSAMIYYRPQSDIGVKTFALRNLPGSSMLKFERRDRLLALSEIRWKSYGRLYLRGASFLSIECLNKL